MTRGRHRRAGAFAAAVLVTTAVTGIPVAASVAGAAPTAVAPAHRPVRVAAAQVPAAHPSAAQVPAAHPSASPAWWVPPLGNLPWQWELSKPLTLTNAKEMGTGDRLPDGSAAPAPAVYDIDGIINSASTVAALHARGKHVVCYVEVGAAGDYYSAGDEGVTTTYYNQFVAAGVLGASVSGYPEYYVDIRSPATVAIVESMIAQQCAAKGFDAVETDIDESYHSANGLDLTKADEVQFMTTLAAFMHAKGLGWWIKNPDDTGDDYATIMAPLADAVLTEQCNQYSSCNALASYLGHKAVFNAEYHIRPKQFCPSDLGLGINGAEFNLNLTGVRKPCA